MHAIKQQVRLLFAERDTAQPGMTTNMAEETITDITTQKTVDYPAWILHPARCNSAHGPGHALEKRRAGC
jgi:hypothetical protein